LVREEDERRCSSDRLDHKPWLLAALVLHQARRSGRPHWSLLVAPASPRQVLDALSTAEFYPPGQSRQESCRSTAREVDDEALDALAAKRQSAATELQRIAYGVII
jgi:hypothetical protein